MGKMINLTIDGRSVQAPEGVTLIDAAELNGIHIPNLCYLKGMKGIGACRLCQVEVEGMKAPLIACTTKVKEGMVINTMTEKIQEVRKFSEDFAIMYEWFDAVGYDVDLGALQAEFGVQPTPFREWASAQSWS